MEEMEVDEFLDIVVDLRERVKALERRVRRLEEEVMFEESDMDAPHSGYSDDD